jgi:glycosyltransferase involved in cell wall biosynthesis
MNPLDRARPRVAVLIPALDEEEALPRVLEEIPRGEVDLVLVVDNGSQDGTAEVARRSGARVVSEPVRGYGRACLAGLRYLLEEDPDRLRLSGADTIVFLDGDHSDHPADMSSLLAPIRSGDADLVIGTRMSDPEARSALLPQARFGNRLACLLMRVLFGARYTDLGPFRAIRVDALRHLRMQDLDYGWTVEMQLKAAVARLRVTEVPVRYRVRIGRSKITGTVAGSAKAGVAILRWILVWRWRVSISARRFPTFR